MLIFGEPELIRMTIYYVGESDTRYAGMLLIFRYFLYDSTYSDGIFDGSLMPHKDYCAAT